MRNILILALCITKLDLMSAVCAQQCRSEHYQTGDYLEKNKKKICRCIDEFDSSSFLGKPLTPNSYISNE
ncbi:MAG: hypothetical protein SFU25_01620 [Candidatus Caenarcaniphilales bacterium]|nr:hypothetical protein [Candidatus Caenarcaniphilales bacterium]